MVHVRYAGRSLDLDVQRLELTPNMTDNEIKERVARYLDVAPNRLRDYVVDRGPKGSLVIRPEAVYG
ncbi:MAG: hypothetical protein OHK0029_25870 [Armatimonadaceae bacterium]